MTTTPTEKAFAPASERELPAAGATAQLGGTTRLTPSRPFRRFSGRNSTTVVPLAVILVVGAFLRLIDLGRIGFNSDEAVYASQAASIAGLEQYKTLFPVFRAHPLLFQTVLSILFQGGTNDVAARVVAAAFGVATIALTYLIGSRMYGKRAGLVAAAFLAVMPYHVVVTRQVLLDGPMVFFATATLYAAVRFAQDRRSSRWLLATAVLMGLTFLTKETSVLLLVGLLTYLFISPQPRSAHGPSSDGSLLTTLRTMRTGPRQVLAPALRHAPARLRQRYLTGRAATAVAATLILLAMMAVLPLSIKLSGRKSTGQSYLAWQLFRRSNHSLQFYLNTVPAAIGLLLVAVALVAVALMAFGATRGRPLDPAEKLLLCWAVVPILGFEIYPVKGYQYLLPIAPVVAVLAAKPILRLPGLSWRGRRVSRTVVQGIVVAVILGSLVWPTWNRIVPSPGTTVVAGSGGVPEGREAGQFVADNLPEGAQLLTVGPSMANIITYYSHRRATGLSVSPNPLNRNPSYTAVDNPDSAIRQGTIQYLVWDAYSASRSPHFAHELLTYVKRFNAQLIHTFTVTRSHHGTPTDVIRIYEVRKS